MLRENGRGFRRDDSLSPIRVNFLFSEGGLGDYICWTPALLYYKEHYPWVRGDVFVPEYFRELADLWLADSYWKIYDRLEITKHKRFQGNLLYGMRGNPVNALGEHLYDLGFYYMMNSKVPFGHTRRLPEIKGNERDITKFGLPNDYVVVTTGATQKTRELPASTINRVIAGIRARNLTPVFVGKKEMTPTHKAEFQHDINWSAGIDLREKTSVLEVACVLANARAVLGLDNGLLHLASCSSVPVIFGFTNVDPALRVPYRAEGRVTRYVLPSRSLECRFCTTYMRGIVGHRSGECRYNDLQCVKELTAEKFLTELDNVL